MNRFNLYFGRNTTHFCEVVVYSKRKKMVAAAIERHKINPDKDCDGLCWQHHQFGHGKAITVIYLAGDDPELLDTAVHECVHAACFRADLSGFQRDDRRFEEDVAQSAGFLSAELLTKLKRLKALKI